MFLSHENTSLTFSCEHTAAVCQRLPLSGCELQPWTPRADASIAEMTLMAESAE